MEPGPPGPATEIFGLTLRQLRAQAGLSLRELGKRALYDYTRLSRAERGEILIPEPQVQVLDDVLHAGGLLVALRHGAASVPGAIAAAVAWQKAGLSSWRSGCPAEGASP